jgi:mannuronan synthase
VRPGAPNLVEAVVSAQQAKKLLAGDVAELNFAGGTIREIQFVEGRDSIQPILASDNLRATFALAETVPEIAANAPVSIRIVDARFHRLTTLFSN